MSVLAGYDVVIEVSPNSVLEIIQANGEIDGESINPPFEMFVPLTIAGVPALGHIIVSNLALFLQGDAGVRLVFVFENSSIAVQTTTPTTISLLDGTIDVLTTMELADVDPPGTRPQRRTLSANLAAATATLTFSTTATGRIGAALAGTGIATSAFTETARQTVEQYIRGVGRWNLPVVFRLDPGFFGSIQDGIFEPKQPGIRIEGSVTLDHYTGASEGVYHCDVPCLAGDYSYTEMGQAQVGTFVAVPTMLGSPLTLDWRIEKIDGSWSKFSPVSIVASAHGLTGAGTIALHNVETQYPTPLPNGIEATQDVHVAYDVKGSLITLENNAGEGCFRVKLSVVATDPAGQVASGYTYVYFYGDVVEMGDGYQQKVAQCIRQWIHAVESHGLQRGRVPPWVPVNYPRPDELVNFLGFMLAENSPQAQQLLPQVKLAHGTSYYRAMFSVAAGDILEGPEVPGGRRT